MYGESPTDQGTAIVIETVPLPLTVSKPEFEAGWRDRGYALFFYVHFFLVFVLACYYGSHALSDDGSSTSTSTSLGVLDVNAVVMMKALTAATAAGGAMSAVLYAILRRCSGGLILTSLWLSVACQVACGSLLFAVSPFAGVMMLILAGFSALYIYFVRARIAFATAHVNVALAALRGAPSVLAVAVLLLLLQFVWVAIWGVAALGLEHAVNNGGPGSATSTPTSGGTGAAGGVLLFLALTSFYYTSAVLRNAVAFISASVVGSWWFEGSTQKAPVRGALGRAFTTSFGTLSFGALLISAVAALRVVARSGRRRSNENIGVLILACIGECLLRILQMVVEWANHWVSTSQQQLACKPTTCGSLTRSAPFFPPPPSGHHVRCVDWASVHSCRQGSICAFQKVWVGEESGGGSCSLVVPFASFFSIIPPH